MKLWYMKNIPVWSGEEMLVKKLNVNALFIVDIMQTSFQQVFSIG